MIVIDIMDNLTSWLSDQLLAEILQSNDKLREPRGSVSILRYLAEPAIEPGCNFLSTIIRVKVQYSTSDNENILSKSFLVKAPLASKTINEVQLVENELQMYNDVLPKMYEVTKLKIAPKRFISPLPEYLVMEDLKETGYVMCDSTTKLDYKHTKAALIAVAKFHAASIAVKNQYPDIMERNGVETVYTHEPRYANRFKPRILMRLYGLAKVLQTIDGLERFGDILIDTGEEFWDLIVEVFKPTAKLNVLNHGDLWTNNILFKYDSLGHISDVKLVDYQLRRYGSPAIDLLYLFWTSVADAARMRMYELLEMYRHTLNSFLAEAGCPERLTRQELKEHISKCSPTILTICLFLPVIFPDRESPFDVSKIDVSEECMTSYDFNVNPILQPFKAKYYRHALPEMCRELETMKIFQVLMKNKKNEI